MLLAFLRWSIPDILSLSLFPLHFTGGLQDPSLPFSALVVVVRTRRHASLKRESNSSHVPLMILDPDLPTYTSFGTQWKIVHIFILFGIDAHACLHMCSLAGSPLLICDRDLLVFLPKLPQTRDGWKI